MTADGELFVTEHIRDLVSEKIDRDIEIDVNSIEPKSWCDAWSPSQYPSSGSAVILDETGKPVGEVKWTVRFYVEEDIGGKYIDAEIDELEIKLYSDSK